MRVPSPEIYRLPIRASERPAHRLSVAWVRKRKGEPSAPIVIQRSSNSLDPDFPTVEGCRTHQDAERLSCVRRRLPVRAPDLRNFIAHVYPTPMSTKALHTITPHRNRSCRPAAAKSARTRQSADIAMSLQVPQASLRRHYPSNSPLTTLPLHQRGSATRGPPPSLLCSSPQFRCRAGTAFRSPHGFALRSVRALGNSSST